ncbi:MAG: hypothetical protein IKS97_06230 [Fibrobacter sp.]|nr:hypothetical protein [Fibrobacter sp.]
MFNHHYHDEKAPPTEAYASTGGNNPPRSRKSGIDLANAMALEKPCGMRCDTYPDSSKERWL